MYQRFIWVNLTLFHCFIVRSGAQYSQVIRIFDMFISRDKMLFESHRNNFMT